METLQRVGQDEWLVFDGHRRIAIVRRLKDIGPGRELVFRAVTWAPDSADRILIGYLSSLRMAAWCVWQEYSRARKRA